MSISTQYVTLGVAGNVFGITSNASRRSSSHRPSPRCPMRPPTSSHHRRARRVCCPLIGACGERLGMRGARRGHREPRLLVLARACARRARRKVVSAHRPRVRSDDPKGGPRARRPVIGIALARRQRRRRRSPQRRLRQQSSTSIVSSPSTISWWTTAPRSTWSPESAAARAFRPHAVKKVKRE